MNEQIRRLADQAGFIRFESDEDPRTPIDWSCDYSVELNQFAELIVRECADLFVNQKYMVLNPLEPFANERVRALKEHDKNTVRKIKQHFGVE